MHKLLGSLLLLLLSLGFTACFNDLDTVPLDEDLATADVVYDDPAAYEQVLAKLYAGLSVSGQQGPAGLPDISGIDEGFSTYLRQYWKAQELTTDEAVIAWNDGNIHDYEEHDWNSSNEFITAMYNRIFYQITLANEFIRETTEEKLAGRGQTGTVADQVAVFRAEARFLRALSYWHALDLFRNVPFVTEEDAVGSFFPEQINANELFAFIESELLDIESTMVAARQNEYGRADQAAVWTLLAKLYLNAEAHVGQDRNTDCITYCKKVIEAGYSLEPEYANLYVADNGNSPETIFAVLFDGQNTRTWGGMTFITHAAVGGSMDPLAFGLDGGWGGTRATSAFVNKFPSAGGGGQVVVAPQDPNNSYNLLNVPGAYQGWDPANNATALAQKGDANTFEGYAYFAEAGEFKFARGSWDENYGDNEGDGTLEAGGGNLSVAAPGYYRIYVDLNALTYSITPMQFGLIGSATPGGWDNDTDMTYNPVTGAWELEVALVGGQEIKFRANDAWDLNYGDDGANGLLEQNGANIAIARDGVYKVSLFLNKPDYTYGIEVPSSDGRAMFYTDGQSLEITDVSQFTQGYAITKFKNVTRNGVVGSDLTFPDTDFLMFRLADVYLMYAEAVLRNGSGGSIDEAVGYINELRERAYGNTSGNIQRSDLNLPFILDERARELYWECHRRTDLVRFGQFTDGTYVWPFKGGTLQGTQTAAFRDVFPIPAADLGANPNLQQNTGY
ncbi:RagB/SusD family nutrient uptake outer membrane protein [Neolewinella lacunae]|uniref:RagB/SusD family nutrient uptake outer membrane protein n=1 Tax=Neolewinella lacunae TaxID=1517758 RepID=A0A923PQY6_9BACT|nr:RagB/SusD family nutrient uptake outer membrane protein [Neolewinella lacunae]MBC6996151.1 RagB/SusD family nutrient uptake outer membrane protein [Neolewinella lacunae]MDN3634003.1 RagB/SusD family nutrient uptake outer membrane protein [Neolewinella lacunae]